MPEFTEITLDHGANHTKTQFTTGLSSAKHKDQEADTESNAKDWLLKDQAMFSLEANPEDFPDGGRDAYLVLTGAFFGLMAVFGVPNGMGAIQAYISKNQLADLKPSTTSWIFTLNLCTMYFGGVFAGTLFDKYGSKKLLTVGSVLIFVGLIATAELKKLYHFILSFGIVTALGLSLAQAPLFGVLSHWFLRKRAMTCSIATIGGLVGASIFAVMLLDLYTKVGYKWALRILAFISLFCMTVATFLVKERKELKENKYQVEPEEEQQNIESEIVSEKLDHGPKPTGIMYKVSGACKSTFSYLSPLKDMRFVTLTIAVFLADISNMTIFTYLASFALAGGIPELKAYILLTVVNVSGIPARLITGFMADKMGRFNMMIATSILSAIFIWCLLLPSSGNLPLLYCFAVFYGMSGSAVLSLIAACLGQICPALLFGNHYGVMYFCIAFLTVVGLYTASLVINSGTVHEYKMWAVFEGCITTAGVVVWVWARWCNVKFRVCKF